MGQTVTVELNKLSDTTPKPKKYIGWRVDYSVLDNPIGMPVVGPAMRGDHAITMTRGVQLLGWRLMQSVNSLITPILWKKVHHFERAFNNFPQNGYFGGIEHTDYISGENLDATDPRYDKVRVGCNQFVTGEVIGDYLVVRPGIDAIDFNAPFPSVGEILDRGWFVYGISTNRNTKLKLEHFPQGRGGPVIIPFIIKQEVQFPISWFKRWEADTLPEPLNNYLPKLSIIEAEERSNTMLEKLKGWKTYIVFLAVLINGILAQFGWGLELPDVWQGAASILLSILALFMRSISDGPPALRGGKG